jgi:epoxyqueuosine reductase QueG
MDRSMRKLSEIWPAIERVARAHGVVRLGASGLDDEHAELFEQWIARGDHATMSYLAKNAAIRRDPRRAISVGEVGDHDPRAVLRRAPEASPGALSHHIARYALGDDYHDVLDRILREFESVIDPGRRGATSTPARSPIAPTPRRQASAGSARTAC